jgi:RNA polymerase sigma-70 factor, ECF subfamily
MTDSPLRLATTETLLTVDSASSPELDRLLPLLYDELREIARRQLARERRNATLQPTELVHEVYLRLVDDRRVTQRGRAYFFGAAARAMRHVLIESARRRGARKRGGGERMVTLDDELVAVDAYAAELLDLDRALAELERRNPRHARVVECRYFGGLSVEETTAALDVSPRTVKSDWALARAWLYAALRNPLPEAGA